MDLNAILSNLHYTAGASTGTDTIHFDVWNQAGIETTGSTAVTIDPSSLTAAVSQASSTMLTDFFQACERRWTGIDARAFASRDARHCHAERDRQTGSRDAADIARLNAGAGRAPNWCGPPERLGSPPRALEGARRADNRRGLRQNPRASRPWTSTSSGTARCWFAPSPKTVSRLICRPMVLCSRSSISAISLFALVGFGSRVCRRAKASSRCVRAAAREAAP